MPTQIKIAKVNISLYSASDLVMSVVSEAVGGGEHPLRVYQSSPACEAALETNQRSVASIPDYEPIRSQYYLELEVGLPRPGARNCLKPSDNLAGGQVRSYCKFHAINQLLNSFIHIYLKNDLQF